MVNILLILFGILIVVSMIASGLYAFALWADDDPAYRGRIQPTVETGVPR